MCARTDPDHQVQQQKDDDADQGIQRPEMQPPPQDIPAGKRWVGRHAAPIGTTSAERHHDAAPAGPR
jgi:hypothetical protein